MYLALSSDKTSVDERLKVLSHVKLTVVEFTSPLVTELIGLIDRETELLNRNRPGKFLTSMCMYCLFIVRFERQNKEQILGLCIYT